MAQKTVAQLTAEIASELPTNGANQITAADVRGVLVDMVDSAGNLADGTPATLYSGNGTLADNRVITGDGKSITINDPSSFTVDISPGGGANQGFYSVEADEAGWYVANGAFSNYAEVDLDITSGSGEGRIRLQTPTANITLTAGTGVKIGNTGEKVGFLGADPVVRPVIPATPDAQDIADVLVALGLASQAA